ncbi:MAG: hypothetical protein QOF24_2936 [Verrucomicrobiota bacterium]|jgi:hypothetical protein
MIHSEEEIYNLLPAIYRIRDEEGSGALRALVGVLAKQAQIVESDIARLHENWFIETCEEWVVPYLGDLLGVRGLHPITDKTFSLRARVANTLAYRRRKGTAAMLEQLAHDSTGWPAHAVEFFELLNTTQNYNHLRPHNVSTPDLRRTDLLELLDTPFDRIAHTADVRHIANRRGKHNIPNVGLFLWRLQSYPLSSKTGAVTALALASPPAGRFTFSPLGLDTPLFNRPEPEREITHLAEEINVPGALRRRPLYDELEALRQALAENKTAEPPYFFGRSPVFEVFIDGGGAPVPPEEILICDLSAWHIPDATKLYTLPNGTTIPRSIRVAVDPVLGRITVPAAPAVNQILVNYSYGFSGDMGGGPYDRADSIRALRTLDKEEAFLGKIPLWQRGVSQVLPASSDIFPTLASAIQAWNLQPAGTLGTIALLDSRTYVEDLTGPDHIEIPEGSQLLIYAANLAKEPIKTAAPKEQRPHLRGSISVEGTAPAGSDTAGELILNGLLIEGDVKVLTGPLSSLRLNHCTIVPSAGEVTVNGAKDTPAIWIERSICGKIALPDSVKRLSIKDSIVDGAGSAAVVASGARADLQASTFFGDVGAKTLEAGNSIFMGKLTAQLQQEGCVRFCFLPEDAVTPRRYRRQPDLALEKVNGAAAENAVRLRIRPSFTSDTYGEPGYAQLKLTVPAEIATGADDGAEMGAFYFLKQPQREANLRASLDEYLRFGLEAGIFYAT